jgi:Fe(3+) dicitrate transport protein
MKTIQYLFVFCILISSQWLWGSESKVPIHGRIRCEGQGVPFVAVYVKGTTQGVATNSEGYFRIEGDFEKDITLGIKALGYKSAYHIVQQPVTTGELVIDIERDHLMIEQIIVSGARVGQLRYLPGSAGFIDPKLLETSAPLSGNEVFRNIPGLHVVEEEGAGLRLNVGVRGLDPDKSRNVLILEDGIPIALAPYGEPEMYFTPSIDRMSGVEILKGSGSILFGPQTVGGVINYLTADPPLKSSGKLAFRAGDKGFFNARLSYGNTIENFGYNIDFQRKQADNFGPTSFRFHDLNIKLQNRFSPVSVLTLKLGFYDEGSNSTYVGLTQPMYNSGTMDDLRIAPNDMLDIRRYAVSANHRYSLGEKLHLNTTAYAYTTVRNWHRQEFSYSASASRLTGVVHGFPERTEGAIYLRNSTGNRNRQFEVAGIEPRLSFVSALGSIAVKTDAGVRFHYEKAFEQRVDGTKAKFISGNLREDEIRRGQAISLYLQNKILFNNELSLTLGLRSENFWHDREIFRINYIDTLLEARSLATSLIPGAGVNYNLSEGFGLFAGIHKGFAPPRTKDAISNQGVEAEKSWNSELGLRWKNNSFELEYTLFNMNFSNQIIPVSESSGGAGTGYINGGTTLHRGMELALHLPFGDLLPSQWNAQLSMSGTYVHSVFSGDRYVLSKVSSVSGVSNVYENVNGNKTPYSPEFTSAAALIVENRKGWGVRLSGNYTGSQFTDALNTTDIYEWMEIARNDNTYRYEQATASGRIGKLDPYFIANASAWYNHTGTGLGINLAVKNVFDERYIASRRPQGIKVGLPRTLSAGLTYNF